MQVMQVMGTVLDLHIDIYYGKKDPPLLSVDPFFFLLSDFTASVIQRNSSKIQFC